MSPIAELAAQALAAFLRLLPALITALVCFAAVWFAARYPAVPEGVEPLYWRKYTRRFWRRRREAARP